MKILATGILQIVLIVIFTCDHAACQEGEVSERYTVSGIVMDADGEPVSGSVVIPLSDYGVPLGKTDALPVTLAALGNASELDAVMFARTDDIGRFSMRLSIGNYRFVAQTWLDSGVVSNVLAKNGPRVRLDGFVDEIEFQTEMEASRLIEIRPAGTGTLQIQTQTSSPLLLIGTNPLAADPILGFAAWNDGFRGGLIFGSMMTDQSTTVSGLPDGELFLAAFANDNNPGFGGVAVKIVDDLPQQVSLPIIASWSDGHKTPPEDLTELTEYMKTHPGEPKRLQQYLVEKLEIEPGKADFLQLQIQLSRHLNDEFVLSDGSAVRLADGMAAMAYARLQERQR